MHTMTLYRFHGRATGQDPSGYYYPRWDLAQKISVLAATKSEATEKALTMLGTHPRFGGYRSPGWTIIWDRIDEEIASESERAKGAQ